MPGAASVYRELRPIEPLQDLLACGWRQDVRGGAHVQRVVPDGCVDVIWLAGRSLVVAGPATRPVEVALPTATTTLGVRFGPGMGSGVLGLPLSELRDRSVALADVWGAGPAERLADALASADPFAGMRLLAGAVLARRAEVPAPDPLVAAAARAISIAPGSACVSAIGAAVGLSERQLLRRFRAAVGYGPKTLARVLRFQRFLTAGWAASAASDADGQLARLALDAGYADQAHLARECRELAGISPSRLLSGR